MLIDVFLGFNEISLAAFRINYLSAQVDLTYIGQSKESFSGNGKKLFFDEEWMSLFGLRGRVRLIDIDLPVSASPWAREQSAREQLVKQVVADYPDAKLIFSDLDEIPSLDQVTSFKRQRESRPIRFATTTMYRYANWSLAGDSGCWTMGLFGDASLAKSPNGGRNLALPIQKSVVLGHHYSYLNFSETSFEEKLKGFSHQELSFDEFTSSLTRSFCDKYQIDHLGRFSLKADGLLHVIALDQLCTQSRMLLDVSPEFFSFNKSSASKTQRRVASLVVTTMRTHPKVRKDLFSIAILKRRVSPKIYCSVAIQVLVQICGKGLKGALDQLRAILRLPAKRL